MYDTLIIGAGFSGLAAGVRLAHYGQKVAILERHYTIGGLNSFYRLHGRDFDVGLHAVTNYAPRGTRRGPLATILKRLQLNWDDFALAPQTSSAVAFPGERLRFSNDFALLESEVARAFPKQIDNFRRLVASLIPFDDLKQADFETWTRGRLAELITDPLLVEMLLCPLMWYGNGAERDMQWGAFSIMFRSCFLEGFARPYDGIRPLLKLLVKKFRSNGGDLRLRSGVQEILHDGRRTTGVRLDNGDILEATNVLSSAGWPETSRLCGSHIEPQSVQAGRLSFIETHSVLDCQPKALGIDEAIVFFNDHDRFVWERPEEMCDLRTGVICSPNNYQYTTAEGAPRELDEGMVRITALASHPRWVALDEDEYRRQKQVWFDRTLESAVRFVPDFRPHTVVTDMFTPRTIERFTWHPGGTVYGSPQKRIDGRTPLENLYLCGTDQGFVGIIGAMVGGITMASHLLRERSA